MPAERAPSGYDEPAARGLVIVAVADLGEAEIRRDQYERSERSTVDLSCPSIGDAVPFKTESDAFRVAVALGLLVGAAVLVGWLASRAYGVVVFAAGVAAGITFELAGRETGRGSALQHAADAPHFHGASGGTRTSSW